MPPARIRTHNLSRRAAADLRLRPRGHWVRPPAAFSPQKIFLVLISLKRLSRLQGHCAAGRIISMKNYNEITGNRTRDLPACSLLSQRTEPPRAPISIRRKINFYLCLIKCHALKSAESRGITLNILSLWYYIKMSGWFLWPIYPPHKEPRYRPGSRPISIL